MSVIMIQVTMATMMSRKAVVVVVVAIKRSATFSINSSIQRTQETTNIMFYW